MIKLADGRGLLYQWDTGRQVECDAEQVHFSNHHYGTSIDVDVKNGKATIPNQLLTSATPIKAWAWVKDSSGEYTKEEQIFAVAKRNKPSDYVYTPAELKTWQDLQNQIGDLNNLKTAHKDNLVNAINDAALGGGTSDFIIKMTVEGNDNSGYTVTSCDTTVEQIDEAVAAEKRVILVASVDGTILELPMVQGNKGNSYYFCAILSESVLLSSVYKIENTSDWSFGMIQIVDITAEDVGYPNSFGEGAPENVGQALDMLITGFNATRNDILRLNKSEHTHSNKDTLDKLSVLNGKLQYNGSDISVTKDDVVAALGYTPQAVSTKVSTGSNIALADNTEYRLTDVTTLTLNYPAGDFECWMRLSFAASGDATVILPTGTKYIGTTPDFKNGETWEMSIKDGVVIAQKVGDGT